MIMSVIRTIFASICTGLCYLADNVYNLIGYLAAAQIFDAASIKTFGNRIYALIGIFMIFKLSFSILTYIVDPEKAQKTGGKFIVNIAVSLGLIVLTPWLFTKAFQLQSAILQDNTIGKIFLGIGDSNANMTQNDSSIPVTYTLTYGVGAPFIGPVSDECKSAMLGTDDEAVKSNCDSSGPFEKVYSTRDITYYYDDSYLNLKTDGAYIIDFNWILAPLSYIVLLVCLIGIALDIAVRIVKLGFLQLIAPVPIIMYMDPNKSGKDSMLGKWATECLTTYLDLFARLAVLYFGIAVIQMLLNNGFQLHYMGGVTAPTNPVMNFFIMCFVILGIIFFIKKIPDLVQKILGVEFKGSVGTGFLKKAGLVAGGGIVGGAVGSVTGAKSAFATSRNLGNGRGRAALSALGGIGSGFGRGAVSNRKWNGKDSILKNPRGVGGKISRSMNLHNSTDASTRSAARKLQRQEKFGVLPKDNITKKAESYKKINDYYTQWNDAAKTAAERTDDAKRANAAIEIAKRKGDQEDIRKAETFYDSEIKRLKQEWSDDPLRGKGMTDNLIKATNEIAKDVGLGQTVNPNTGKLEGEILNVDSVESLKDANKISKRERNELETSSEYIEKERIDAVRKQMYGDKQ